VEYESFLLKRVSQQKEIIQRIKQQLKIEVDYLNANIQAMNEINFKMNYFI